MKVIHPKTNTTIAHDLKVANSFFERAIGVMFVKEMKGYDALLIEPCNSVHNCFVRFSIDVVFLNSDYKIVKILRNFRPWRFSWIYLKARKCIEFPAGVISKEICEGDTLEVTYV